MAKETKKYNLVKKIPEKEEAGALRISIMGEETDKGMSIDGYIRVKGVGDNYVAGAISGMISEIIKKYPSERKMRMLLQLIAEITNEYLDEREQLKA